jgi:hypothetical protein
MAVQGNLGVLRKTETVCAIAPKRTRGVRLSKGGALRVVRRKTRPMSDRLNLAIGRRDLLRALTVGAAAASVAPVAEAAAAPQATNSAKPGKARYRANSPEVQTFYRVNRYPVK